MNIVGKQIRQAMLSNDFDSTSSSNMSLNNTRQALSHLRYDSKNTTTFLERNPFMQSMGESSLNELKNEELN